MYYNSNSYFIFEGESQVSHLYFALGDLLMLFWYRKKVYIKKLMQKKLDAC